jgi:sulfite exporter TauE/SafE
MTTASPSTFRIGIVLGIVLIVLGIGAYVLSDFVSLTALIPAFFGALVAILSVVGYRQPDRQRLAAYGIGLLAVLGVLGSTRGLPDIITLLTGGAVDSPIAAVSQGAMIAVCAVLIVTVIQLIRNTRMTTSP